MRILFLHGWHSVPGGVKPIYLKDHGHEVLNPALDDDEFALAVNTAQAEFDLHQPQVVVGSSRGGAVAMNINSGAAKLVLLCPAWKKFGKAKTVKPGTVILHSRGDDVVPFGDSEELAKNSGATLIEVGTDHRLADPEPLAAMLKACEIPERTRIKSEESMTQKAKYDPPQSSTGDNVHTLVRAGVGSLPVIGAAATELFQKLIVPPLEKRRQEWMEAVAQGLRDLEERQKCVIDDLASNDVFIDTVMAASQAAIRSSQQEKREALKNAVLNAALPSPPDELRQQMFVNLVETLTVWHLRILRLFADPVCWFQEQQRQPPQHPNGLSDLLTAAYPELQKERGLYDQIGKDLFNRGLLGTEGFHSMMTGSGVFAQRATELGEQFLKFITKP
ncbi:MAG: alpha/beta hydrolase [Planctomycetota bacterium]